MKVLALLRDTWWQTRAKVVFVIVPILLALGALFIALFLHFEGTEPGQELRVTIGFPGLGESDITEGLLQSWVQQERMARDPAGTFKKLQRGAEPPEPDGEEGEPRPEPERPEDAPEIERITPAAAAVAYIQGVFTGSFLFSLMMLFFIFGAASIIPDTLTSGTVDLLISKPLGRFRIYGAKYLGGLLIVAANLAIFVGLTFLVLTVKSGYANWHYLLGGLTVLFAFAVLNAILHFFGVLVRSTVFSILMGYALYLVLDTAIEALHDLVVMKIFEDMPAWAENLITTLWYIFPNFGSMKKTAVYLVMDLSVIDWTPIWTSGLFGLVLLAWGYWIFRRREY